jgi:hypothetical protein
MSLTISCFTHDKFIFSFYISFTIYTLNVESGSICVSSYVATKNLKTVYKILPNMYAVINNYSIHMVS